MQKLLSITSYQEDLTDFPDEACLKAFLRQYRLDGFEMLAFKAHRHQIPKHILANCTGVHATFFGHWLDFWLQDQDRLNQLFSDSKQSFDYYGENDPQILVKNLNQELHLAQRVGAKYVVVHASEVWPQECYHYRFHHADETVVDAVAAIVNAATDDPTLSSEVEILFENIWWAGFSLTRPEITERLLCAINHPKIGIMYDLSHICNTNTNLTTQEEACAYAKKILEAHGELRFAVRGVHVSQSLSGEYVKRMRQIEPPDAAYQHDLTAESYLHILQIDRHQPFHSRSIRSLMDYISPEYLVHEFISLNNAQRLAFLETQNQALFD